jgi:hypothetical protein
MNGKRRVLTVLGCTVVVWSLTSLAEAIQVDKENTMEFRAKIQTRVSLRTEDSSGFTFPEVETWDLVQHRNIAYIEFQHDLRNLAREAWYLKPFQWGGIDVKYRLVGRFLYEGVYDYGPQQFQDVRDADKDTIDDFKKSSELWEGYADFDRGPLFVRFGRQSLVWGETDIFRLLDGINPLDNTYGGIFEDLDDRRIPLVILRTSYNFGRVGPVSSTTLEGFWNPTGWDNTVAPRAPFGTVYAAPTPPPTPGIATRVIEPEKDFDASRYGFRLQGVVADNYSLSIAHYRSYRDTPVPRVVLDPGPVQELVYEAQHVTGGTLSFWQPNINAIIRSEVAWFWDEPVFIPEENLPLLFGVMKSGTLPKKNILRYSLGADYKAWIRPLNSRQMFTFLAQYFGQWITDYDDRQRQPLPEPPAGSDFAGIKEYEQTLTLIVNTTYRNGTVVPQVAVAYDPRGVWFVQPQVNFIREPLRFMVQYSMISGQFTNYGFFRDRDQVAFILSVLF